MRIKKELRTIYDNINNGMSYGYYYEPSNDALEGPLFHTVLCLSTHGNIYWNHYGSSCNSNKLSELKWVINTIFHMTEYEFVNEYQCVKS